MVATVVTPGASDEEFTARIRNIVHRRNCRPG